jgi:Prealbumin-like fold domain
LTVTVNASGCPCVINGTISGIGGNGATVTLAGAGAATVTASSTGTYTFTGLSSGTYTVTPIKPGFIITPTSLSVTITSAGVSGVNFTSTAQLGVDKTVSTDRSSKSTSIASPAFSTAVANELLLAFVASDANSSGITVSGVTGGGLTWSLVKRTNTQLGTAEIWKAFAPTIVANVTVTATLSQSVAASITVVTFTGADATGTGGSGAIGATSTNNANPGAPTASLLTTRNNSWVFGVGGDWDNGIGRTLGVNQTMVHQYLATIGDTYWVQRQTGTTPTSGTLVTINDTAPTTDRYNLSICEVLPAQ